MIRGTKDIPVFANVSGTVIVEGTQVSGVVAVSGGVIVSGTVNAVVQSGAYLASGLYVVTTAASGTYQASGVGVQIQSGAGVQVQSGYGVLVEGGIQISGTVTANIGKSDTIRIGALVTTTAASGGTKLGSGLIHSVIIKNLSGNADIFIGGSGTARYPYSGFGFCLAGEEAIVLDINNIYEAYACANTSGNRLTYVGTDY